MSRLTDFYRGLGYDSEGRSLAEIWSFSDEELERVHDFIQWLFPLRERSRFNPAAPLLTDTDIAEFRSDPQMHANVSRSFELFLAFLGLRYEGGNVLEGRDFAAKADVWRSPNHNWLRITRVLVSTHSLGLEDEARALFAFLKDLRASGRAGISDETFRYWLDASR